MFTLIGWQQNVNTGGVLTEIDALADQHIRVEDNNIIVPRGLNALLGAYHCAPTATLAQLSSPSLRRTVLLDIAPIDVGTEPASPPGFLNLFYSPIALDEDEALRALVAGGEGAAERKVVLAWLGDGPQAAVQGEFFTIRATGNTTLTAYAWTNVALTFTQTLPAGRYAVVGMRAQSAGCLAARLVFVGGVWRPGCIGADAISDISPDLFRGGRLGVWGEFEHTQPPTVDFLSASADTSEVVYLDIAKLS